MRCLAWIDSSSETEDGEDEEEGTGVLSCPVSEMGMDAVLRECAYPVDGTSTVVWYQLENDLLLSSLFQRMVSEPVVVDLDQLLWRCKRANRGVLERGKLGGGGGQRGERICLRVIEECEEETELGVEELRELVVRLKCEGKRFEDHATGHLRELSGKVWRFERFADETMRGINEIMR